MLMKKNFTDKRTFGLLYAELLKNLIMKPSKTSIVHLLGHFACELLCQGTLLRKGYLCTCHLLTTWTLNMLLIQ